MLIVIKLFAEDQSEFDSPELAAHLAVLLCHYGCLSYKLAQSCHWSVQKKVGNAFCATLYASCLFFPVHLSWKRK